MYYRFRWIFCQLAYLRRCIPARIRHALEELPTTLDETYARTLEEIDEQNWDFAHRLLQCVAAASRPLRAEELAEFLAFDFKPEAGSTPTFLADWRSEDPENDVISICSTLLVVVKPPSGSPIIQFAHFSVKEYLTSARLAETKHTISRFHVSMTAAHTIVVQACLGVLLHLDENITKDNLSDLPLAVYAAEHWADHALFESVSSTVQDGMKRLFDPSRCHLSVWVWIYDPTKYYWIQSEKSERPAEPRATPLHYAAACNMHDIATFLIVEHSQDVNSRGFEDKETPLHVSSRRGHVEISRILLDYGADIEARDDDDYSPLDRASIAGHVKLVKVLVEYGADTNAPHKRGDTPLLLASSWGNPAGVRALLDYGADVVTQNKDKETPLHRAKEEETALLLLKHGADVNARDIRNETPLHHASRFGFVGPEVVRVLLEHGADANARDADNAIPLHLASGSQHQGERRLDVVRVLLEHGSDTHARDRDSQTPFMRATTESEVYHKMMKLLLEHGAVDHRV